MIEKSVWIRTNTGQIRISTGLIQNKGTGLSGLWMLEIMFSASIRYAMVYNNNVCQPSFPRCVYLIIIHFVNNQEHITIIKYLQHYYLANYCNTLQFRYSAIDLVPFKFANFATYNGATKYMYIFVGILMKPAIYIFFYVETLQSSFFITKYYYLSE